MGYSIEISNTPFIFELQKMKTIPLSEADITLELLNEVCLIMAEIVQIYGDRYLPIFIRILKEVELKKEQQKYKEIALQMLSNKS